MGLTSNSRSDNLKNSMLFCFETRRHENTKAPRLVCSLTILIRAIASIYKLTKMVIGILVHLYILSLFF